MRPRPVPSAAGDVRTIDLLTEIAGRYYLQSQSQVDIARDLRLDPSTVSRYLKRARDEGIVHIEIRPPRREEVDLGRELAARYGLARAIVAPETDGLEDPLSPVAAEFVEGLLRSGMRLGISWGNTLAGLVRHLRPGTVAELSIAPLAGGVDDPTPGIQGHELVRRVAELYPDSRVHYLHAQAIVGSDAVREVLLADRTVRVALEAARRSELALVGIGQMDERATLFTGGHVGRADWAHLLEAGAVGNTNTRFFDRRGRPVAAIDRRTIAISWEELRAIPTVVAVAAGSAKLAAIEGALRTGAIDMLVTDEVTARGILESEV
ncbi:MAG: sugar-binding transcriptional regulator [Candidatus Limnocylindrales bacterium]